MKRSFDPAQSSMLRRGLAIWLTAMVVAGCAAAGTTATSGPAAPGSVLSATAAPSVTPSPTLPASPAASVAASAEPSPTATASATDAVIPATTVDYRGSWKGTRLFGSIKWCGRAKSPYWAVEVHAGPDQGFLAFDIPPGGGHAAAEVVTSFVDPAWNKIAAGTGTFVPGNPAHFVIENGEGRFDIKLEAGTFCSPG